jgi:hypothetical protein
VFPTPLQKQSPGARGLYRAVVSVSLLVWLLPLFAIALTSTRSLDGLSRGNYWGWPTDLRIAENYTAVFTSSPMGRYLLNSVAITLPAVAGTLAISTMAGYALAQYRFRGNIVLFATFIAGNFVPFQVLMIPVRNLFVQVIPLYDRALDRRVLRHASALHRRADARRGQGVAMRLDGLHTTLLLAPRAEGLPEIVHWGARLPPGDPAPLRDRAPARNLLDDDIAEASVFPTLGAGLFRTPALVAHRDGRDWSAEFGDAAADAGPGGTLTVTAHGRAAGLRLLIKLALLPDGDMLAVRATLANAGETPLAVEHLASGVLRIPPEATELRTYGGRWAHQFTEARSALLDGALLLENRRGRTSHDRFPLLVAATPGCGEQDGAAWGVHLGWNGNHRMVADRLGDGRCW